MKVQLQSLRLDTRYETLKELAEKEFSLIQKFINEAKNGENNKGIDIKEETERKYVDCFNMAYRSWKKPLLELNKESLTKLKQDLKFGKIQSRFKKPYSERSQREMELILIRFLEFANPKKYSGMRKWFIVKVPKKDVDYLKESEIEKLYNNCKNNEDRFLMAVLFDTGARASEFLNIRFEDITKPTQNFPYYKINLKEEYSKTKGRNIGLYWKHSTEAIKNYLSEVEGKPQDPVFNKSYDAIRIFLTRLGKRVLGKRIHFHIFRKSSATHYATILKGDRSKMCYRYGWAFSSNVPDVYISRSGMKEEAVKDDILNSDLGKIEKENQELKTKINITNEEVEELKESQDTILTQFNSIIEILNKGRKVTGVQKEQEKKVREIILKEGLASRNLPKF